MEIPKTMDGLDISWADGWVCVLGLRVEELATYVVEVVGIGDSGGIGAAWREI